jgi:hypothetical protein
MHLLHTHTHPHGGHHALSEFGGVVHERRRRAVAALVQLPRRVAQRHGALQLHLRKEAMGAQGGCRLSLSGARAQMVRDAG